MQNAKHNDMTVFNVMTSDLNNQVITVNMIIPETNDTNLLGQKLPSNPVTAYLVPSINNQVMGTPSIMSAHFHVLAQVHNNGPFTWIHTTLWPIKNNNIEIKMYRTFILIYYNNINMIPNYMYGILVNLPLTASNVVCISLGSKSIPIANISYTASTLSYFVLCRVVANVASIRC